MKKLTQEQLDKLQRLLIRNGSSDTLTMELLDHLACEVEGYLWKGYNFDLALEKVSQEANQTAIKYLKDTYRHDCAMTDEQLQNATLDDIVFEFRNKEYGAYDLRMAYPKAMRMGLFGGVGLFCLLISGWGLFTAKKWEFMSSNNFVWMLGIVLISYAAWIWFSGNQNKRRFA